LITKYVKWSYYFLRHVWEWDVMNLIKSNGGWLSNLIYASHLFLLYNYYQISFIKSVNLLHILKNVDSYRQKKKAFAILGVFKKRKFVSIF